LYRAARLRRRRDRSQSNETRRSKSENHQAQVIILEFSTKKNAKKFRKNKVCETNNFWSDPKKPEKSKIRGIGGGFWGRFENLIYF